jgi:hypothetical protein
MLHFLLFSSYLLVGTYAGKGKEGQKSDGGAGEKGSSERASGQKK